MNTISLAIASIVDAHTSLGYTRQLTKVSPSQIDAQVNRGKSIRSKVIFDLVGTAISWFGNLLEKSRVRAQERRDIEQLLRLNPRLQKDIGLIENDLQGLRSGLLSLEELEQRRRNRSHSVRPGRRTATKTVRKSILDLESANADCFELAKCS